MSNAEIAGVVVDGISAGASVGSMITAFGNFPHSVKFKLDVKNHTNRILSIIRVRSETFNFTISFQISMIQQCITVNPRLEVDLSYKSTLLEVGQ